MLVLFVSGPALVCDWGGVTSMPFTRNLGENSPSFLFSTEKTNDLDLTGLNLHSHLHVVLMVCFLFNADFKLKLKFKVAHCQSYRRLEFHCSMALDSIKSAKLKKCKTM